MLLHKSVKYKFLNTLASLLDIQIGSLLFLTRWDNVIPFVQYVVEGVEKCCTGTIFWKL
jgi:hypothetical protein